MRKMENAENFNAGRGKKEHSIKVPKLYKEAAKALKKIEDEGEGVKNAVHSLHHPNVKAITALVYEAMKNTDLIKKLIDKSKILENEKALGNQIALVKILITELLWGKKRLGGGSKPVVTVLTYKEKFDKVLNKIERKNKGMSTSVGDGGAVDEVPVAEYKKPRYARVNTLKSDLETVVKYLINEGWILSETDDYINLEEYCFAKDGFVDNLLVFPIGTELFKHPLYLEGTLVLQDKASCLPPLALKPRVGRTILDACAAPGMKTSLLSALTKNEGCIIAIERDAKRCETLRGMLDGLGATNVTVMNKDFTDIVPQDHPEVEYILVDPSCSGSGMYNRIDLQYGSGAKKNRERLKALSFYQRKLLVHAMKFPNVKRIVYSTCSINSAENEDVIGAALEWGDGYIDPNSSKPEDTSYLNFQVKQALPNWGHRVYNQNYGWSELCIKSDFENDWTDGFFVAVLERVKNKK